MFNELVFKNDPDKQNNAILYFLEWFHLPHSQVSVLEDRTFYHKVIRKLDLNSNFNFLVNCKFVSLYKF